MGDDELNFTEEEAQCWADDPRNQPQAGRSLARPIAIWLIVMFTAVLLTCLATSPVAQHATSALVP